MGWPPREVLTDMEVRAWAGPRGRVLTDMEVRAWAGARGREVLSAH